MPTASSLLIRGFEWPLDLEELDSLVITDEGEIFTGSSPVLGDKEDLLRALQDHKKILEFGFKFSMKDPIAYDVMSKQLEYICSHYKLPLL